MTIALATHVGLQKNGSRKVLDLVVQLICFIIYFLILLLARYVPTVAKRSIWGRNIDDRPTDRRSTNDRPLNFENFKRPYLCDGLSDPLHVWFYGGVFEVGGSNGAISGFAKSKMAAEPPSWKIQMAISPRRIIRFTPCLVLERGFRDRMALIPVWPISIVCGRKQCARSN